MIDTQPLPPRALAALDILLKPPMRAPTGALSSGRRVHRGQILFRQADHFGGVYLVRLGTLKMTMTLDDGREQVTGFPMQGDLLGLDALSAGAHACTVTALEDSEVCLLPFLPLKGLGLGLPPEAVDRLLQLAGEELVRDMRLRICMVNCHSDARVAAFLLHWSARLRERGWSEREFDMRMSRAEIGSFLGMASESVSRALTAFARGGWIAVERRRVRLLSVDALAQAARTGVPRRIRHRDEVEPVRADANEAAVAALQLIPKGLPTGMAGSIANFLSLSKSQSTREP